MTQLDPCSQLFCIATALKPGQAIDIDGKLLRDASMGDLSFLDRYAGFRPDYLPPFLEKIQRNWDIRISERMFQRDRWTIYRPSLSSGTAPSGEIAPGSPRPDTFSAPTKDEPARR